MQPLKGNPATLAACGAPKSDLAGASIPSVDTNSRPLTQADAKHLARIVFGKPPSGIATAIGNNGLPYWRPA